MKKVFSFIALFTILISCNSDDIIKSYVDENEAEILEYVDNNDLNVIKDDYGFYYIIEEQGTGLQPTDDDVVTISFERHLIDGTPLDDTDTSNTLFPINQMITGLRIGTTYLSEGGKGKFIIPAHLAYGSSTVNNIPVGSVVIFDMELHSVNFNKENEADIQQYLTDNNLTDDVIKTDSGLYYIIEEEGTGEHPTSTNNVTVAYNGYFVDGTSFDKSDDAGITFNLQGVIEGWTEGIPYFKEGGKGKLIIPSKLAYGNFGNSTIPGGSVLIFDIDLISIND